MDVELSDELVAIMCPNGEPVQRVATEHLVSHLLWQGTITGGTAARVLGMTRPELARFCESREIPTSEMTEAGWDDAADAAP